MNSPLVLAVPTFNSERFLPATLESLNAQGEHVRWWLQDGASRDRTVEIARSYARPGDTIISELDSGQTDALNRAMSRMGGEIIGFLNGDDCLLPGAAERILDFFSKNPDVDIVCGEIEWIDKDGTVTGKHSGKIESLTDVLDIYGVWWKERQWVQPEVFYRRAIWERVEGFDTSYHLAFDYDFWVRCFLAGARVAHLAHPLTQFRRHAAQKSTASEQAADEIRSIVQKHLAADPTIDPLVDRRVRAELAYDLYQSGKLDGPTGKRSSFLSALVRNPNWLRCTSVRARIVGSFWNRITPSPSSR